MSRDIGRWPSQKVAVGSMDGWRYLVRTTNVMTQSHEAVVKEEDGNPHESVHGDRIQRHADVVTMKASARVEAGIDVVTMMMGETVDDFAVI